MRGGGGQEDHRGGIVNPVAPGENFHQMGILLLWLESRSDPLSWRDRYSAVGFEKKRMAYSGPLRIGKHVGSRERIGVRLWVGDELRAYRLRATGRPRMDQAAISRALSFHAERKRRTRLLARLSRR